MRCSPGNGEDLGTSCDLRWDERVNCHQTSRRQPREDLLERDSGRNTHELLGCQVAPPSNPDSGWRPNRTTTQEFRDLASGSVRELIQMQNCHYDFDRPSRRPPSMEFVERDEGRITHELLAKQVETPRDATSEFRPSRRISCGGCHGLSSESVQAGLTWDVRASERSSQTEEAGREVAPQQSAPLGEESCMLAEESCMQQAPTKARLCQEIVMREHRGYGCPTTHPCGGGTPEDMVWRRVVRNEVCRPSLPGQELPHNRSKALHGAAFPDAPPIATSVQACARAHARCRPIASRGMINRDHVSSSKRAPCARPERRWSCSAGCHNRAHPAVSQRFEPLARSSRKGSVSIRGGGAGGAWAPEAGASSPARLASSWSMVAGDFDNGGCVRTWSSPFR